VNRTDAETDKRLSLLHVAASLEWTNKMFEVAALTDGETMPQMQPAYGGGVG
jgi:hypothetical protein